MNGIRCLHRKLISVGISTKRVLGPILLTVSLSLLDGMKGLSMSALRNKDIFYLEAHEYDRLLRMINLFVEMYIKSLKK